MKELATRFTPCKDSGSIHIVVDVPLHEQPLVCKRFVQSVTSFCWWLYLLPHTVNCVGFCFSAVCDFLFFFVCAAIIWGTPEWICAKFTGRTCLGPRLDEFECQGQRSKFKVTEDKFHPHWKCIVMRSLQIRSCSSRRDHSVAAGGDGNAQRRSACRLRLVKHLCCSYGRHSNGQAVLFYQSGFFFFFWFFLSFGRPME